MELEDKMKMIKYIEMINPASEKVVDVEERARKREHKELTREVNKARELEIVETKNKELKARMGRVYQKVGRQTMPRSQKKQVKREVREVKIDEETLDRQRYLGELLPVNPTS